jgi:hypothetical protein
MPSQQLDGELQKEHIIQTQIRDNKQCIYENHKYNKKYRKFKSLISISYNIKLINKARCDNVPFQDTYVTTD